MWESTEQCDVAKTIQGVDGWWAKMRANMGEKGAVLE